MSRLTHNDEQHEENLQRFTAVNARLEGTETVLGEINGKMDQLLTAVIGNSEFGTTGLVKRTADLEQRADSSDKRVVFIAGVTSTLSALLTGFGTWWAGHK